VYLKWKTSHNQLSQNYNVLGNLLRIRVK